MFLSPDRGRLALSLLASLDVYANSKLQILPALSLPVYGTVPIDEILPLRDALFDHPELIDAYLRDNPDRLGPSDLAVVESWKQFVRGSFAVIRFLKKGAILGGGSPHRYFAVLGLTQPIEDALGQRPCPVYLHRALLLPFDGKIIYDGLVTSMNVFAGPGLRRRAREEATQAQKQGKIVESFDPPAPAKPARPRPQTDWRPVVDQILEASARLKNPDTAFQGPAFSLVKAAGNLADLTLAPDGRVDVAQVRQQLAQARRAVTRMESALVEQWRGR